MTKPVGHDMCVITGCLRNIETSSTRIYRVYHDHISKTAPPTLLSLYRGGISPLEHPCLHACVCLYYMIQTYMHAHSQTDRRSYISTYMHACISGTLYILTYEHTCAHIHMLLSGLCGLQLYILEACTLNKRERCRGDLQKRTSFGAAWATGPFRQSDSSELCMPALVWAHAGLPREEQVLPAHLRACCVGSRVLLNLHSYIRALSVCLSCAHGSVKLQVEVWGNNYIVTTIHTGIQNSSCTCLSRGQGREDAGCAQLQASVMVARKRDNVLQEGLHALCYAACYVQTHVDVFTAMDTHMQHTRTFTRTPTCPCTCTHAHARAHYAKEQIQI